MPNLVSSCLAAVVTVFEEVDEQKLDLNISEQEPNFDDPIDSYRCYLKVLQYMWEHMTIFLLNFFQPRSQIILLKGEIER